PGRVPTPPLAFLPPDLGPTAGVVISASHNPAEDNGIKFFGREGYKLSDDLEDRIEMLVRDGGHSMATGVGTAGGVDDSVERCIAHVTAAADAPLSDMRIVVDCANGAAYRVGPEIIRRLGADVISLFDTP